MPVEVDTSQLQRAMAQLAARLDAGGTAAARAQAENTAGRVRQNVPRRTGRLAATVQTTPDGDGWAVTYGGGLPYANYIDHRSHATERGLDGAQLQFHRDMEALARSEVARL